MFFECIFFNCHFLLIVYLATLLKSLASFVRLLLCGGLLHTQHCVLDDTLEPWAHPALSSLLFPDPRLHLGFQASDVMLFFLV